MKYGENLIITGAGAFECLHLVYLITSAVLGSLTYYTAPRYESLISCLVPKFCAHRSVSETLWCSSLYATKGALLNIIANRSLIEESSNYVLQLPQLMWRGCYM